MQNLKRIGALLLVFVLILGTFPAAHAATPAKNDSYRHAVATALSTQAQAYYTGPYTWEALSTTPGMTTNSSLAAMGSELYEDLQTFMTVTQTASVSYKSLTTYWPYTDTQPGASDAVLFYSDVSASGYNREHVWPKSRASFYQTGGGCDLHHLRPTDININSLRGNATMGNVRGVLSSYSTASYGGKTVLYYSAGEDLVEVNDNIKGDVARILLYVYVRWGQPNLVENVSAPNLPSLDNDDSVDDGKKVMENLDTLLAWCKQDPVDQWEMTRNDRCQDVQGNRNVFIDYPELAWLLFGRQIPTDMQTPSGYAKNGAVEEHTITVQVNDPAWGSASLSGTRITAQPNEGYYTQGFTVSPETAAQVTQNGNILQITSLTTDVTVTVNFAPRAQGTIILEPPLGVTADTYYLTGWIGDTVTLPGVTGVPNYTDQDYTFVGWVENTVKRTTEKPTVYPAGSAFPITREHQTLYALYAYTQTDGNGAANSFALVTAEPEDWSGDYIMTGRIGTTEYAHLATGASVGAAAAAVTLDTAGLTRTGDTITGSTDNYKLHVEKTASGTYTMELTGAASPTYLAYPAGSSGNTLSTSADPTAAAAQWRISGGEAVTITNVGTPSRILQFNMSAKMFRCYTGSQQPVYLYRGAGAVTTYYLTLDPCTHGQTYLVNFVEAACLEGGYSGDRYCCYCNTLLEKGHEISALGHDWDGGVVTVPATEEPGVLTISCRRCDACYTEVIPAQDCPSAAFTDVDRSLWYHKAIDFVVAQGIMNGMGDGTFAPMRSMTRAETAQILYKLAGSPYTPSTERFTDVNPGDWFLPAVSWAVANGVTSGISENAYGPGLPVTREQMITLLYRYVNPEYPQNDNLAGFLDKDNISMWARVPMNWAVEAGILRGSDGYIRPLDPMNRAEVAQVLMGYLKTLA